MKTRMQIQGGEALYLKIGKIIFMLIVSLLCRSSSMQAQNAQNLTIQLEGQVSDQAYVVTSGPLSVENGGLTTTLLPQAEQIQVTVESAASLPILTDLTVLIFIDPDTGAASEHLIKTDETGSVVSIVLSDF